jgi:putative hydrolase of the HAD superfamily
MALRRPALIFDFGNVVAHFDYGRACARYGPRLGMSGVAFLRHVQANGFPALLRQYESGRLAAEAFSRAFRDTTGLDITHDEFAAAWSDIFWLNEPVAGLIAELKGRGYPLVLGSNTNDLHAAQFRRQFATTLAHFDRLVLSYEIGHVKPSPEFYRACAAAARAETAACVFIDDLAENVEGARAAGMAGVLFRSVPALIAELRAFGVEVP